MPRKQKELINKSYSYKKLEAEGSWGCIRSLRMSALQVTVTASLGISGRGWDKKEVLVSYIGESQVPCPLLDQPLERIQKYPGPLILCPLGTLSLNKTRNKGEWLSGGLTSSSVPTSKSQTAKRPPLIRIAP